MGSPGADVPLADSKVQPSSAISEAETVPLPSVGPAGWGSVAPKQVMLQPGNMGDPWPLPLPGASVGCQGAEPSCTPQHPALPWAIQTLCPAPTAGLWVPLYGC